jgi:hypothetical protein
MPTPNPRTNVTLSPSLDLLVSRLAVVQKSSKSQVLRELLEAAEPALQRAVALMEAAVTASSDVRANLARSLEHAQDAAESQLAWHNEVLEQSADLVQQGEAIRGRRATRGGARKAEPSPLPLERKKRAGPPVPVTRGVGQKTGGKKGVSRGRV